MESIDAAGGTISTSASENYSRISVTHTALSASSGFMAASTASENTLVTYGATMTMDRRQEIVIGAC